MPQADAPVTVQEESYKVVWGYLSFFLVLVGIVLLQQLDQTNAQWFRHTITGLLSVAFTGAIWAFYKVIEPLYYFRLSRDGDSLLIEAWQGSYFRFRRHLPLNDIAYLGFREHEKRLPYEALYDFSSNYIPVYLPKEPAAEWRLLIEAEGSPFTFRLTDLRRMLLFIKRQAPSIHLLPEQEAVLGEE